jgi:hypothetical protein
MPTPVKLNSRLAVALQSNMNKKSRRGNNVMKHIDVKNTSKMFIYSAVRSESRCALRLRYVDLVVSIEVAVEVFCCFTVFSC